MAVFNNLVNQTSSLFSQVFTKFIVALVIILLGFIIGKLVGRLTYRVLHEFELDRLFKKIHIKISIEDIVAHLVTYFIYLTTLLWAFSEIGLTTTLINIISISALILIIISILLAIKDFVPNAFAGLVVYQKGLVKAGDKIQLGTIEGKVLRVRLTETVVKTSKGDILYIPNSNITKKVLLVKRKTLVVNA
jgi:small-conductance mechanosensitive channel